MSSNINMLTLPQSLKNDWGKPQIERKNGK